MKDIDISSVSQECADYLKQIYAPLCFNPEQVSVTYRIGDLITFTITASEVDDGILIGKAGATIQAVRLLVHIFSKANMNGYPCIVEVKDHRGSNYNPLLAKKRY